MGRHDLALEFRASRGGYPPDRLLDTKRRRVRTARRRLGTDDQPGILTRLVNALELPTCYVIDGVLLGLPIASAKPRALYNAARVDGWRSAIWLEFVEPWWARLEVGETGFVHAHVLAEHGGSRLGLRGQPLRSLGGFANYLAKPHDARGLEAETEYLRHRNKAGKRTPALTFGYGIHKS
jgi:hypothetical protein